MHILFPRDIALMMPPGILFICSGVLWYCFEVDSDSLRQVLTTFRGFMICCFTISIWICHILRCVYVAHIGDWNLWSIAVLDLSTFTMAIALMLSVDCVRHISNYIRFVAPSAVVLNSIYMIYAIKEYEDFTLFEFYNGSITLNQIEMSATIELILFLFTLIFAVVIDYNHQYYCIITDKIRRKLLLPHKDYGRDTTNIWKFRCKTLWFYRAMTVLGILSVIHFVIDKSTDYENEIINLVITSLLTLITIILMVNHLSTEWKIWKRLFSIFRPYMLILSICIRLYAPIQKAIWGYYADSVIDTFCYPVAFNLGMILLLTRDAMLITYPIQFSIAICIVMLIASLFNCVRIQFFEKHGWPSWYLYVEKASYLQVIMFTALTLKCIIFDPKFEQFVLIRDSKPRDMRKGSRKMEISKTAGDYECDCSMLEITCTQPNMLIVPQDSITTERGISLTPSMLYNYEAGASVTMTITQNLIPENESW